MLAFPGPVAILRFRHNPHCSPQLQSCSLLGMALGTGSGLAHAAIDSVFSSKNPQPQEAQQAAQQIAAAPSSVGVDTVALLDGSSASFRHSPLRQLKYSSLERACMQTDSGAAGRAANCRCAVVGGC